MLWSVREEFAAGQVPSPPNTSGPSVGVWDTGVNMLARSGVSHAARVDELRVCRGLLLSHAGRRNHEAIAGRRWPPGRRRELINDIFLDTSGPLARHSSARRNHDCR